LLLEVAAEVVPEAMVRVETAVVVVSDWVPIPVPAQVRVLGRMRGLVWQQACVTATDTGTATVRVTLVPVRPMEPDTEVLQPNSILPKGMKKGMRRPPFRVRITLFL
jgi:hypothetical protein